MRITKTRSSQSDSVFRGANLSTWYEFSWSNLDYRGSKMLWWQMTGTFASDDVLFYPASWLFPVSPFFSCFDVIFTDHIFEKVSPAIEALGMECKCLGGGKIEHNSQERKIRVFGESTVSLSPIRKRKSMNGQCEMYSKCISVSSRHLVRLIMQFLQRSWRRSSATTRSPGLMTRNKQKNISCHICVFKF